MVIIHAQFCLPFYRSFHTIIFKKQEAKEEVNKYLAEAKDAIEGSKSKELLFEAVENLANALKEVQNLENLDLEAKKGELNFYRKYCDRAAELMKDTEEKAPFATEAMRKGLPILDRNLKELIEEIQEESKDLHVKESKGTATEEIACAVNREVQKWEIGSQEEMKQRIQDLAYTLENKVAALPGNEYVLNKIELMRHERDLNKQYEILLFVIAQIPTIKVISETELDHKLHKLDHKWTSSTIKTLVLKPKWTFFKKSWTEVLKSWIFLSLEVGGKEGELVQTFSKKILELKEKGDKEALKSFLEEILKNENALIEEIENSSAPPEEKEESKSNVSKIRSVLNKVKNPIKSFGKDVTNEIIVSYAANGIVELVFQLVSMATLGFPIPVPLQKIIKSIL